ncbi:MAG: hypothetical protein CMG08_07780 [Candidatus Marinimicrobia bacterium]|nr:hypothetical protein [Candidatus Neomarinimicrobiota bacterium]
MKLIEFGTSYKELMLKNRPSKIIKSPYVGDAVDENGKSYLVHMPGLSLGGQCVPGSKFYATLSPLGSKTDFIFQSVLLDEKKYGSIIIGGNPFSAEKVSKFIFKNKLINDYLDYELIKKPKNYVYNGDLYIKNKNEIISIEVKNVVCATYDPNRKIGRKDSVFYDSSFNPFRRSAIYPNGSISQLWKGKKVVSERSVRQLEKMINLKKRGIKFIMLFIVNRDDCIIFKPNWQRDPIYSAYLKRAYNVGIDIIALRLSWNGNKCYFDDSIKIDLKKW